MIVDVKTAKVLLDLGYVIGIPTDTVYGFCAKPEYAYKLYNLKGRSKSKKLITMVDSFKNKRVKRSLKSEMIIKWPGNTTFIFEEDCKLNSYRIPNEPNLLELLKHTGYVVTSSANYSGDEPCLSSEEFESRFSNIPLLCEKQKIKKSENPSTILLYNRGKFKKLR